jgi:hypothetical protein
MSPSTPDLGACLATLDEVIASAEALGLDASRARAVAERARQRLGFAGTAFVLALAGGTGVGKSSLLNALAGAEVSRAGPVRPVTDEPVAWAPADQAGDLGPLLSWVGAGRTVTHADERFADLCLLDLPDYDSVERGHRVTVDQVLPKVDAICWVLDPEKYNDRVLHEDYLRPLAHHADRAVFALNRADTLGDPAAVEAVVADVRRALAADGFGGRPVFAISADPPDGRNSGELGRLRAWLTERIEAKAVVVERIAAECLAAGTALGRDAGVGIGGASPLVAAEARGTALELAVAAARQAVDVDGVRTACVRRARAEARLAGAGPFGRVLGWLARRRGGGEDPDRSVDPVAYARGWRRRATLAQAVVPVRELTRQATAVAPAALRREVSRRSAPELLGERLTDAVEGAVAQATTGMGGPPRRRLWPAIGVLQAAALAAVVLGVLWLATLWLAGQAGAEAPELPGVYGVPVPVALIGGGIAVGLVLGRVLEASALLTGRRWGRRLAGELDRRIGAGVEAAARAPLAELEAARSELLTHLGDLRAASGTALRTGP